MNDPRDPYGRPPPGPPPPGHQPRHPAPGQPPPGQPPPGQSPYAPPPPGYPPYGPPPPGASPHGPPPGYSPYGPPPPGYPGPGMPYLPPRPQLPIWGGTIAALVLSIACFFCLGPLGSIPGLVLGIISLNKCKRNPELYGGKGIAIAAVVIGAIGSFIWIAYLAIMLVALIAGGSSRSF